MRRSVLLIVLMTLLQMPAARAEESLFKHVVPRTELIPISTLTISDEQFLKGDSNGTSATIAAELRIANVEGKQPLVILMHASGGIGSNVSMWVPYLNELGISTFVIDGFAGRGISSVSTNQSQLGRLNFIIDIYRALDLLAKHPRVDPNRIALMGFSRGGSAVLYASQSRFQTTWNKSGIKLAAYLPFYPDCSTSFLEDTNVTAAPIRIFGGTDDDYNPIARCKDYVTRMKAAGADVQIIEYPNTHHAFDNPNANTQPRVAKGGQSTRQCELRERELGTIINAQSGQPFTYSDPCVERDPHVGFNPEATTAARASVAAILKDIFKTQGR
jgi:dienelactone hydrolase